MADTVAPIFQGAVLSTDGKTLTLKYNETLALTTAALNAFVIKEAGVAASINNAVVNDNTVVLTLASAVQKGAAVTVAYTAPAPNGADTNLAIQDSAGNDAKALAATAVTNNSVVDTITPTASVTATSIKNTRNATVKSSEVGTAYLVKDTVVVSSLADITNADDNLWNSVAIRTANTATNLSAAGLIDGNYKVYTVDAAGNLSVAATNTMSVDSQAPTASLTAAIIKNTSNAVVQSSEVGTAYLVKDTVTVNNLASITSAANNLWNSVAIKTADIATNLSAAGLVDGNYKVYTVDIAGNLSQVGEDSVTLDSLAPTASVTLANIKNTSNVVVQSSEVGTAYLVQDTVTITDVVSITAAADNLWNSVTINTANTATNLSAAGLVDGNYKVYSVDSAGNLSAAATNKVTIDTTGPIATVSASAIKNTNNLAVKSSEVGTAYLVKDTVAVSSLADITNAADELWNSVAISTANTATNLSAAGLIDGTYQVYAVDKVGNLSVASSNSVAIDMQAPTAKVTPATINNAGNALVQSNELGTAYLVKDTVTVSDLANITSAANNLWNSVLISRVDTDNNLSALDLVEGSYKVYTADAAGNLSAATTNSVIIDNQAPTANLTAAIINNTNDALVQSNELGTAYLVRDTVTVSNVASITGAADNLWNSVTIDAVNTVANLSTSGLMDGSYKLYTADWAGNLSLAASNSLMIDTVAPTIAISSDKAKLSSGQTAKITFTLSEVVTDFALADVTYSGGTLSNFTGSGASYTATFTPTQGSNTAASVSVASGKFSDAAGNQNTDGNDSNNTVNLTINAITLDVTAPTATVKLATIKNTANAVVQSSEVGTAYLVKDTVAVSSLANITSAANNLWNSVAINSANTATNLSAAGLIDGKYKVYTTDAAGNLSAAAANSVTIDTVAPTIAISSDKSKLSSGQVAVITFTLSEVATDFALADVSYSGGTLSNFGGSGTSYTATFTPTKTSTTPGWVKVASSKFSDAAGNLNADGNDLNNTVSLTINTVNADVTPPTANVTTTSIKGSGNAVVKSSEVGTAYLVKDTLTVTSLASITSAADNLWNSVKINSANTATNLSAAGLVDGSYKVYTADAVGNLSSVATNRVVIDNTAPTTTVSTLSFSDDTGTSSTDFNTKIAAQTISGTLSAATVAGEVVRISLDNGATWQTATNTVGNASFSYETTLISSNTLQVRVEDTVGNAGIVKTQAYVLDSNVPTNAVTTLSFSADTGISSTDFLTKTITQTISGTLSGPRLIGETVKISLDNGISWQNATSTAGSSSFSYDAILTGSNTLWAWVEDIAGNIGNLKTQVYRLDSTAPTTTVTKLSFSADTGSSDTDFITNTAKQTISGTLSAATVSGEIVKLSFDDGKTWQTATNTLGSNSFSYDATLTDTNSYPLQVWVEDSAGNAGTVKYQAYELDTKPTTNAVSTLSFSADTGDSSSDFITKTTIQTISGTLEASTLAGEVVKVSLDNGNTWQTATNSVGSNNFSYVASLSASDTLRVQVEDRAGNAGVAKTQAYVLDTVASAIAISSDKSSLSVGQTATITFTLSEASSNFVFNDVTVAGGSLSNFTGSGASYTATFTPTANSTANASITVASAKFTDKAGNQNADGIDINNTVTMAVNTMPANLVNTVTVANNQTYNATSGDDVFIIDAKQATSATISGFAAGDTLQIINGSAVSVNDQTGNSLLIGAGLSTIILNGLAAKPTSADEAGFTALFGANSLTYDLNELDALPIGLVGVMTG